MTDNAKVFLWTEKYRPHKIDSVVLPAKIKKKFKAFVKDKQIPNLILSGSAGVGKTTIARAMLDEIGAEYIILNGSLERSIDLLRNEIAQFASTVSFDGGRKYVIYDEADYLTAQHMQPALRNFIEKYAENCGWILTCNFKEKLIEPLHSRCAIIDFAITKENKPEIAKKFLDHVEKILQKEEVKYDKKAVVKMIIQYFPDWRRVLNELQSISQSGEIDLISVDYSSKTNMTALVEFMKAGDYSSAMNWIADNNDIGSAHFYKYLFDSLPVMLSSPAAIAGIIVVLAKYEYQESFVAVNEINRSAMAAEIMDIGEWK